MSLLAVIPARGRSKGILEKNIKLLSGKPLIAWTIEAAKQAHCIDRFIVSTDDPKIKEVAEQYGAEVPFLREAKFATDESPSIDLVLDVAQKLPGFDWMLLLQPTSPLRTSSDIDNIFKFCQDHKVSSAVSVCEASEHPYWMYKKNESFSLHPFISDRPEITRRQDLPKAYCLNGALYLAKVDWLLEHRSFIGPDTLGFTMPLDKSADIDTMQDWNWAEYLIECKNEK
jgi:CMP-N,N'-diacetyllegionaminic acid synthase